MQHSTLTPTTVENAGLTALIRRLGQDCKPHQFVREFIQNAMEAVSRLDVFDEDGKPIPRTVTVDVDWAHYEQTKKDTGRGHYKICFIDSGEGMCPEDMVRLLNRLSASGHSNEFENYGVGAKIAAFTRNHAGIIYDSWRDGQAGNRLELGYDEESNRYGIIPFLVDEKRLETMQLPDDYKPAQITKHGTRVTLMGMKADEDTMFPPEGLIGGGSRDEWLRLYTKLRYFEVPQDIELRVRVRYYDHEDTQHSTKARIFGQRADLDSASIDKGTLKVSDAKVHWWLFDEPRKDHGRRYTRGHTACVHENEIFEFANNRVSQSAGFGITIGRENVVIYVEVGSGYRQNVARTGLTDVNGNDLPWDRWQDEFRDNMPEALKSYVEDKLGAIIDTNHSESIRERLKQILHLYVVSRYRARANGGASADPESGIKTNMGRTQQSDPDEMEDHTEDETEEVEEKKKYRRQSRRPGDTAREALIAAMEGGTAADEIVADPLPLFYWLSEKSGSRSAGDHLEDRAAYYQMKSNTIEANADFQGFTDIVDEVYKNYAHIDGAYEIVKTATQEAYELQLNEVVMGALSMRNRRKWTGEQFEGALSPEALTTAVMCRYHQLIWIHRTVKNALPKVMRDAEKAESA